MSKKVERRANGKGTIQFIKGRTNPYTAKIKGIRKRIMGHSLKADTTEYYYIHPTMENYKYEMDKLHYWNNIDRI